jgi:hypothetical protein
MQPRGGAGRPLVQRAQSAAGARLRDERGVLHAQVGGDAAGEASARADAAAAGARRHRRPGLGPRLGGPLLAGGGGVGGDGGDGGDGVKVLRPRLVSAGRTQRRPLHRACVGVFVRACMRVRLGIRELVCVQLCSFEEGTEFPSDARFRIMSLRPHGVPAP